MGRRINEIESISGFQVADVVTMNTYLTHNQQVCIEHCIQSGGDGSGAPC